MEAALESRRFVRTTLRHFVSQATTEAELPVDLTVDEAIREITHALGLGTTDQENRPQYYDLFVHRNGTAEALRPTIRIGDAVRDGDELSPLPQIVPGTPRE